MVSLRQFKKDMVVTPEDLESIMTPNFKHMLNVSKNVGYSVISNYAFECSSCASMALPYSVYRVVKETHGPGAFNFRATQIPQIKSSKGIFKLDDLKSEPEYDSHINVVRGKLICDHCKDSVYENAYK